MVRAFAVAMVLLWANACHAATHTVFWTAATGGTYYAYPSGQSLADWSTYRVALTEDGSPNEGRYTGSVDDANGSTWYLFSGATQPGDWGESLAVTVVTTKANVVQISDDATAADNLESAMATAVAEPTGVPPATASLATKISWLYMALRNKITVTGTKKQFYDDSDNAEWEKDLSDDGTTYTETEANAP